VAGEAGEAEGEVYWRITEKVKKKRRKTKKEKTFEETKIFGFPQKIFLTECPGTYNIKL